LRPWHRMIDRALEHDPDGHTWLEVAERVKDGTFLAVEIPKAAVLIVERLVTPAGAALSVVLCAGFSYSRWLGQAIAFLKELAKDQDCKWIKVAGREGWEKILPRYGFRKRSSVLSMEL